MHFNPRSPCGERRRKGGRIPSARRISIHAPRVGSDHALHTCKAGARISIHAPRVGSDSVQQSQALRLFISIHAPRVGSDDLLSMQDAFLIISIHAPRVGSDFVYERITVNRARFQSTLPVWGATSSRDSESEIEEFQSTLPVWGATFYPHLFVIAAHNFNPRSPCGERRGLRISKLSTADFNPRSPCGERPLVRNSC